MSFSLSKISNMHLIPRKTAVNMKKLTPIPEAYSRWGRMRDWLIKNNVTGPKGLSIQAAADVLIRYVSSFLPCTLTRITKILFLLLGAQSN